MISAENFHRVLRAGLWFCVCAGVMGTAVSVASVVDESQKSRKEEKKSESSVGTQQHKEIVLLLKQQHETQERLLREVRLIREELERN